MHRVGKSEADAYEECIVRVLIPTSVAQRLEAKKRAREQRRLRRIIDHSVEEDGENSVASDGSATTVSPEFLDTGEEYTPPDHIDQTWKAKYRFPIKLISIKGTHRNSVFLEIDIGKQRRELRELIFDNLEDSKKLQAIIKQEKELDKERSKARMKVAMGGKSIRLDESITFLIEIVSGWDLPAGDFSSSDPYVGCFMEGKEYHRTDFISKTLDPIWTVMTGSLFLLTVDVKELFRGEGLLCVVYDYDKVGGDERLGACTIPPKTLYDAKGERMEFKLGPPPGKTQDVPGYLAIRCRRATEEDKEFMKKFADSKNKFSYKQVKDPIEAATKGGASNLKSIVTRRSRMPKFGPHAGIREVRSIRDLFWRADSIQR